jgi:hypothetical protein
MKTYPLIQCMVKHGRKIALGVALLLLAVGVYGWLVTGHAGCVVGGVLLAGAGYFVLRVCVEVLEVIADTLLPR